MVAQFTTFIGRAQELVEIATLLADPACRLLTLVGPGGIGKTRLAVEATRTMDFPHGVHFAPLQPVSDAVLLPIAIANAIGIQFFGADEPRVQLLNYLRERQTLLILDNFEHLADGVDFVVELLSAPGVRLLVTSRTVLNVQAEWRYAVGGLDVPENGSEIENFDAVKLFAERARRVRHNFSLADHPADVIRICQLTEGMPLALELAAGWLKVLSCAEIANEIQRGLDFLAADVRDVPERHRSMAAAFAQSWKLLTDDEQKTFRRMSVFRGGFTREAAENVTGATLQILASLVDKSLLRVSESGRYDVHELLRQYGEAKLAEAGEIEAIRDTHSGYYLHFVAHLATHLKGQRQIESKNTFTTELDNIYTAWYRAIALKEDTLIEMTLETLRIIYDEGFSTDQTMALEILQNAGAAFDPHQPVYWHLRASYFGILFRSENSRVELERCLEVARFRQDHAEIAFCLYVLGFAMTVGDNDIESGLRCWEESCALYRELDEPFWVARDLWSIGFWSGVLGRTEDSNRLLQESLKLSQQIGDICGAATTTGMIAGAAELSGNHIENERILNEAISLYSEFGAVGWAASIKGFLLCFGVLIPRGDWETAHRYAQEALQICRDTNFVVYGVRGALYTLGIVASLQNDYHSGQAYLRESKPLTERNRIDVEHLDWAEAVTACGLEDYSLAEQALCALLRRGETPAFTLVMAIRALPIAAILFARAGSLKDAVELLGLTSTYPAGLTVWVSKWRITANLRRSLEDKLGVQAFAEAWARGRMRSGAQTMQDILRILTSDSGYLQLPSGTTIDQLTARELEVLHLVASGRSNRQIAQELIISIGTVKSYIHAIYSKLGVERRTQAVVRARELHLL